MRVVTTGLHGESLLVRQQLLLRLQQQLVGLQQPISVGVAGNYERITNLLAWRSRTRTLPRDEDDPCSRREWSHLGRCPDGDVDLCLADPDDEMSDDELARLNEALARGFESIKAGRFRPAAAVVSDLRRR